MTDKTRYFNGLQPSRFNRVFSVFFIIFTLGMIIFLLTKEPRSGGEIAAIVGVGLWVLAGGVLIFVKSRRKD